MTHICQSNENKKVDWPNTSFGYLNKLFNHRLKTLHCKYLSSNNSLSEFLTNCSSKNIYFLLLRLKSWMWPHCRAFSSKDDVWNPFKSQPLNLSGSTLHFGWKWRFQILLYLQILESQENFRVFTRWMLI